MFRTGRLRLFSVSIAQLCLHFYMHVEKLRRNHEIYVRTLVDCFFARLTRQRNMALVDCQKAATSYNQLSFWIPSFSLKNALTNSELVTESWALGYSIQLGCGVSSFTVNHGTRICETEPAFGNHKINWLRLASQNSEGWFLTSRLVVSVYLE